MKNSDAHSNTRYLLHRSKLEISNPDFSTTLMEKIRSENRKRVLLHSRISYFLLFLGMDATVYLLLRLLNIKILSSPGRNGSVGIEILENLISLKNLLFENHVFVYTLFAVMLFTVIHKIASTDYKYSS